MLLHDGPVIRSRFGQQPPESTPFGDQKKLEFIADMESFGEVLAFWMPDGADTTTNTDLSRHGFTWTYDATVAGKHVQQGSGVLLNFDGSTDEADTPDNARFSRGGGSPDQAMAIVCVVEADDATPAADTTVISKWDEDTDAELREWRVLLTTTNGYPRIELYDESANAFIGREDQTALTVNTVTHLVFTYDGSGSNEGIRIYKNGVRVDDADSSSGTYLGMEDLGTKLLLAHNLSAASTPVAEGFWDGGMGMVMQYGKDFTVEEAWENYQSCRAYFNF